MPRPFLLMLFGACLATNILAQEEKPVTVVKPGEVTTMKAVDERASSVIILSPATATGDFDQPPTHPDCVAEKGQEILDCTAARVKELLREKMGEPSLDLEVWGTSPVSIDFALDQFGVVKDIRVEHSGDGELPKHVIVALYELPNFNAAVKDGKAVGSRLQVNYRYEELFQ